MDAASPFDSTPLTADQAKDYRNLLLLWDTVSLLAASPSSEELAASAVDRLSRTLKLDRAGFFVCPGGLACCSNGNGAPELLQGVALRSPAGREAASFALGEGERKLLGQACAVGRVLDSKLPGSRRGYALPLAARGEKLGCLYLSGPSLDAADLRFLEALRQQDPVEGHRELAGERERRCLEAEIAELRQASRKAHLVYRSPQMKALLKTVRQVAQTDATVLVTGASGTGKELLAQTLHELSPRSPRPPVVVDCGAIAGSLIDNELFGHERGAYTGADRRVVGRLAEADGSTLILDEIGELSREVQSKLLRFVQEKQLTPVGATRPKTLDVRLVAVSNRDLEAEVAAGRFREDLFHRLNVVHLLVPPLAARPEDVDLLADHFVDGLSRRYGRKIRGLTEAARAKLHGHPWPGNVRELRNRILRAVVLCEGDRIGPRDLDLAGGRDREPPDCEDDSCPLFDVTGAALCRVPASAGSDGERFTAAGQDVWAALRKALRRQVEAVHEGAAASPLGRWLAEDLVLAAHAAAGGVASRGAGLLGIAETTYRRRLAKAGAEGRSASWESLAPPITELLCAAPLPDTDLLERARRVLLEEIAAVLPHDRSAGAALLGVSRRTYLRWREALPTSVR